MHVCCDTEGLHTEMALWKTLGYVLKGSGWTTGIIKAKIAYCKFSRVNCITSCTNSPSDHISSKSPTRSVLVFQSKTINSYYFVQMACVKYPYTFALGSNSKI